MIMQSSTVKFHILFLHDYHLTCDISTVRTLAFKLVVKLWTFVYNLRIFDLYTRNPSRTYSLGYKYPSAKSKL